MEFFNKFNLDPSKMLKIAGVVILGVIIIAFALSMLGSSFKGLSPLNVSRESMPQYYGGKSAYDTASNQITTLGISPSPTPPYYNGGTTGDDAEEFEITEYNATIETKRVKNICPQIARLKEKDYVIFENANEHNKGCSYYFKVKRKNVEEILSFIKDLNPKELTENTYTIKRIIEDFANEAEILKTKLASIDETLKNAINAYDNIADIATRAGDAESLAKIIDSKIKIIERLTLERININTQLERLRGAEAEQLDRLEYTYFRLNIIENKFVDGERIKDSWRAAVKSFVSNINQSIQDITINLISFLFILLQYAVYLFIALIVAKYGWKAGKYIWGK